ncbi:Importin-9 [Coccomyxa sp. Obi]|nr:Importin-9 [Coccomyxa sp. Obi]
MVDQSSQIGRVLNAALDSNPDVRQNGEALIKSLSLHPGFGHALVQASLRQDFPLGLRQMAAVLLKQHIKAHWTREAKRFEEPEVGEDEKAAIRRDLIAGLGDSEGKIRVAVGMAVANIAKWDVPAAWPELLGQLVTAISERKDQRVVHGAVRCLSIFVDELDDTQVLQVAQVLFPALLAIVNSPAEYGATVRRRALQIAHSMAVMLAGIQGNADRDSSKAIGTLLDAWFQPLCVMLSQPTTAHDVGGWGVKLEVLRLLVALTMNWRRVVQPHMPALLQHCWTLLHSCLPIYLAAVVLQQEDLDEGLADSDGDVVEFSVLVSQMYEFILTLVGNSKFLPLLQPVLPELAYLTLGYMQMTTDQEETWAEDPNVYVADEEDDMFSVRTSGELVLEEVLRQADGAAGILAGAVRRRMDEAAAAQAAGDAGWWRLREAALLAVGAVSDPLLEAPGASDADFDLGSFLQNVLAHDLQSPNSPPFLIGRALWVASRLAPALGGDRLVQYLQAAVQALKSGSTGTVQVGACRAIASLVPRAPRPALQPLLDPIYEGLGRLLGEFSEETLHLVLEALAVLVEADGVAGARWEPRLSPAVLQIWAAHVKDPLLSMDAVAVIQGLASIPAALPSLQERALPHLVAILSSPEAGETTLVEGALDVVNALLRPASPEQAARIHAAASGPVMALVLRQDDPGILQSASEYLRILVRIGGEDLLSWNGADPAQTLHMLLQAVARLLHPDVGDSPSLGVGEVVSTMLRKMPGRLAGAMPEVVAALVAKLAAAQSSPLITSLLIVLAQLVHSDARQLLDFLASQPAPGGEAGNALKTVLRIWMERQIELRGVYEINLTSTALAALLATGHPALAETKVKGRRLDVEGAIRTRSRAAAQAEQWQVVSAPVKIFMLLADMLIEAREGGAGGIADGDDSSDWEEASEEGEEDGHGGEALSVPGLLGPDLLDITAAAAAADDDLGRSLKMDPELKDDPMTKLDLAAFVGEQLRALAQRDSALFNECCSQLAPAQLTAVKECFH